jgi:GT2 family glycosyltransferase
MQWLERCLASCTAYSVIVVDNASTDNTVAFIEANYPKIKLFKQTTNLGFGQANNLGISYALKQGAEHVFLLNQDAYLIDDCLDKLITYQQKNTQYGVLSPIHINATKKRMDENFSNYMGYKYNADFYSDFVLHKPLKEVYQIPFVNAAAWLVSKKCLTTVGGFDPVFFHYGEDNNFCQRVCYHNFKIGIIPTAFVIHDRENRVQKTITPYSEAYYKVKAKKYAIKYANINEKNAEKRINKDLKKLNKAKIKSFLKFDFRTYKNQKKEEKFLCGLKPKLITSYTLNKVKDAHYLRFKK